VTFGRSTDGSTYGVAVASRFLAVGSVVPAAAADAGALATQSLANLAYRADGLALVRAGVGAEEVVERLTSGDGGRASRQLGVVGHEGKAATFTTGTAYAGPTDRWSGGCTPRSSRVTGPPGTSAAGRARRCWSSPRTRGTAEAPTSRSTCQRADDPSDGTTGTERSLNVPLDPGTLE